jgi:hypothetical protein
MSFPQNAPRFAESTPPLYGKGNSQIRSAAFLGALEGIRKKRKLTQSLTHTHKYTQNIYLKQIVTADHF